MSLDNRISGSLRLDFKANNAVNELVDIRTRAFVYRDHKPNIINGHNSSPCQPISNAVTEFIEERIGYE